MRRGEGGRYKGEEGGKREGGKEGRERREGREGGVNTKETNMNFNEVFIAYR